MLREKTTPRYDRRGATRTATMSLAGILLVNLAFVATVMFALWLVSLRLRDVSIVDIWWGLGFVAIAWITCWSVGGHGLRPWLMAITTTLWGTRLAAHLWRRNLGKPEDYRYRAMRERYGTAFPAASLVIVFALQGVLMWIVSLPLQVGPVSPTPLNAVDGLGMILWVIGWWFETAGDWQLANFRSRPENAGRVLDTGLWRYTRHPNYFGDCLVWWGLAMMGFAGDHVWWIVISPLTMTLLLVRVSGVALLEKEMPSRRPEYAEYIRRTSAFIPWPPKPSSPD
jgi:steroid 5-alpha reductase family enzyme